MDGSPDRSNQLRIPGLYCNAELYNFSNICGLQPNIHFIISFEIINSPLALLFFNTNMEEGALYRMSIRQQESSNFVTLYHVSSY